jgi:hypothetical protein
MGTWCTVTITDGDGKRYSLDANADSSYDAAHRYLTHVRGNPGYGLPIPTTETMFEVVADRRIHRVSEAAAEDMDRQAPAGLERAARFTVRAASDYIGLTPAA